MKSKYPFVTVVWNDADTGEEAVDEQNIDSYHKPTVVTTVGWALRHDTVGITICTEYYGSSYRGRTFIPGVCLISVTPTTLSKRRPRPKETQNETPPAAPVR